MSVLLGQRSVYRLSVPLLDEWLRIKEVHLRGPTCHEKEDDTLGPWLDQRNSYSKRIGGCMQQTIQGHRAKAGAGLAQPGAAGGCEG
jgi:hypothetical protein